MATLTTVAGNGGGKPTVAFTTPPNYAKRLSQILALRNFNPLWCPTLVVESTPQTQSSLKSHLYPPNLETFSAIAFTSRTAITALSNAMNEIDKPLLAPKGDAFTVAALGKDSELIDHSFLIKMCSNFGRVEVLVPPIATPTGLVESLGLGGGRRVLCPVPLVVGLDEPPVIPNFLRALEASGWVPVRVGAYETRWAGAECAEEVVRKSEEGGLDAIVFTSTGEVEGLLKSLRAFGLEWEVVKKRCPEMVAAAHGPVTAAGAERLGVKIDVVSSKFDSFDGVADALELRLQGL